MHQISKLLIFLVSSYMVSDSRDGGGKVGSGAGVGRSVRQDDVMILCRMLSKRLNSSTKKKCWSAGSDTRLNNRSWSILLVTPTPMMMMPWSLMDCTRSGSWLTSRVGLPSVMRTMTSFTSGLSPPPGGER